MQVGIKHEARRDITDVAKLVRKDLKAKFGKSWKFSVRVSRYSMGQSLNVDIKQAPCCLFRKAERKGCCQYTDAAELALKTAQEILDSYNRQDIDVMTDYFNVDFFGHVQIGHELRQRHLAHVEQADA